MKNQKKSKKVLGPGDRVRRARYALGYRRQDEFGKALGGFTTDQIGRVERGANLPTPKLLQALTRLGINISWVLTGEGTMRGVPVVGRVTGGGLAGEEPIDEDLITQRITRLEACGREPPLTDQMESALLLMTAKRVVQLERQMAEIVRRLREISPEKGEGGG